MAASLTDRDLDLVNSTIDGGGRLSELRLMFPNSLDAFEYYGSYMASRFAVGDGPVCVCCGRTDSTREEAHTWEALINNTETVVGTILASVVGLLGHHLVFSFYKIRFTTHHTFCRKCSNVSSCKRVLASLLYYVLFAVFFLSLVCAVPLAVFSVAMPFLARDIALQMIGYWGLAMVPVLLSVIGLAYNRRLSVPAALRHIGRFPFKIKSVRKSTQNRGEVSTVLSHALIHK